MSSIRKAPSETAGQQAERQLRAVRIQRKQSIIAQTESELAGATDPARRHDLETILEGHRAELAELRAQQDADGGEADAPVDGGLDAPQVDKRIADLQAVLKAGRDHFDVYRSNTEAEIDRLSREIEALSADNARLAAEHAEGRDRAVRAMAEVENVRKRTEKEKQDIARFAISDFAKDVIGIGDNIQRAIDHVPADASTTDSTLASFLEGVRLLERELLAIIERHGVTRIVPMGERFDPNRHQAMLELDSPEVPPGTIVQVLQPGFLLHERVLRPALVAIARGGARPGKAAPAEAEPVPISPAANDDAAGASSPGSDPAGGDGAAEPPR